MQPNRSPKANPLRMVTSSQYCGRRRGVRRLVIEPLEPRALLTVSPEWLISLGGERQAIDLVTSAAIHPSGDFYITARFSDTVDFDPGPGVAELVSAGNSSSDGRNDVAVARYTPDGEIVWARRIGADWKKSDQDKQIVLDRDGNAYVALIGGPGHVGGVPYSSTAGSFVTKLDDSGNFLWTRYLAPNSSTGNNLGLVVDDRDVNPANWSLLVTGDFNGAAQFGSQQFTSNGNDVFVSRLNASSGSFAWTKTMGGSESQLAGAIALDLAGDNGLYVAHSSVRKVNKTMVTDYVLSRLDPASGNTAWTKTFAAGMGTRYGHLQATGNSVYLGGNFSGTSDFDPGAGLYNVTSAGGADGVVVKLTSSGSLAWARSMGGALDEQLYQLALDPSGNVLTTGSYGSSASFGSFVLSGPSSSNNGFLTTLDANGTFTEAHSLLRRGMALVPDATGNVYVATEVFGLPTSLIQNHATGDRVAGKGTDIVLVRYSSSPAPIDPTPSITRFTAGPDDVVRPGESVDLRVGMVHDPALAIQTVSFYRDNGDAVLDPGTDVWVGDDSDSIGGWIVSASTASLSAGTYTYFAQAREAGGVPLAEAALTIFVPEVISLTSTAVPVQIRDLSTVISTINVIDSFNILDLDVALDIVHPRARDLDVALIAPDGTRVELFQDVGELLGTGANFTGTILDDEVAGMTSDGDIYYAASPRTGRFRPMGSLAVLDGKNANGVWMLEIIDDERRDTGTLNSWSLTWSRSSSSAPAVAGAIVAAAPEVFGEAPRKRNATSATLAASRREGARREAIRLQLPAVDHAFSSMPRKRLRGARWGECSVRSGVPERGASEACRRTSPALRFHDRTP